MLLIKDRVVGQPANSHVHVFEQDGARIQSHLVARHPGRDLQHARHGTCDAGQWPRRLQQTHWQIQEQVFRMQADRRETLRLMSTAAIVPQRAGAIAPGAAPGTEGPGQAASPSDAWSSLAGTRHAPRPTPSWLATSTSRAQRRHLHAPPQEWRPAGGSESSSDEAEEAVVKPPDDLLPQHPAWRGDTRDQRSSWPTSTRGPSRELSVSREGVIDQRVHTRQDPQLDTALQAAGAIVPGTSSQILTKNGVDACKGLHLRMWLASPADLTRTNQDVQRQKFAAGPARRPTASS